jgi:hypothetical protein
MVNTPLNTRKHYLVRVCYVISLLLIVLSGVEFELKLTFGPSFPSDKDFGLVKFARNRQDVSAS